MGFRFGALISIILGGYAFLIFHLYDLQVLQGEVYRVRAESQYSGVEIGLARRGTIYFTDKNGNVLPVATVKDFPLIYAVPKAIDDPQETASKLEPYLGNYDSLERQFADKGKTYLMLVKKADPKLAEDIKALGIRGVYVASEPARFYPFDSMASQLIGYVGPSSDDFVETGKYGVEKYFDAELSGKTEFDSSGAGIKQLENGSDVYLTIDPNVQEEAERVLSDLIKNFNAEGGAAIVEEPKTGKILAMAGFPNFNPNDYESYDVGSFLNPVTQKLYEPGSVFKVLTMSAGIDAGKITPDTTYVDKGVVVLNGRKITNWDYKEHGAYGRITMTRVIQRSVNTGAIFAEQTTGRKIFSSYMSKFGLGEKTGIELPGELAGDIRRLSPKEPDVAFATASYGQGIAVTPIELITAISAVANGGNLMRPYLRSNLGPQVIRRVISPETAAMVSTMMVSAVDDAKVAQIKGYSVAGKTGTAFVPDFVHGGYTEDVINTYVGFAPSGNPKFIVLIKLNKPRNAPLAGTSVVPAFRDLAQFLISYYQIPPDRPGDNVVTQ